MIEAIPDLPDNIVGFTAKGKVTAGDYESVVIPAVEEKFSRHKKIRCFYHIGEEVTGFEAGAVWDDTKIGLKHLTGWEKIAVVTDIGWIRTAIRVFGLALPGHVRVFHNRELTEARQWIGE